MPEDDIANTLQAETETLKDRFGVESLSIFGSAARGDLGPASDVDILVTFQGPATFDRFMGLKFHLEDLLGRRVDLVTRKALRPEILGTVEREGVHVA